MYYCQWYLQISDTKPYPASNQPKSAVNTTDQQKSPNMEIFTSFDKDISNAISKSKSFRGNTQFSKCMQQLSKTEPRLNPILRKSII